MKVEFESKIFSDAFRAIFDIFARSAMASTAGNDCLITAKKTKVIIEAANQGLYVKVKIPANISEEGQIVVNTNYLTGLRFTGKTVKIEHTKDDGRLKFSSGRLKGELNVSQDYDRVESQRPTETIDKEFMIPVKTIQTGVSLISFVPSATDPILNIKIALKDGKLSLQTNDPYRATSFSSPIPESFENELDIVMPSGFMLAVIGKISTNDVILSVDSEMKILRISNPEIEVWHPLQQAQIVDVDAYITELRKTPCTSVSKFKAVLAMDAITTASSIVLGSVGNDVKMELKVDTKSKVIHCLVEAENGKTDNSLDVETVTSDEDVVSAFVSAKQMMEFLSLIKDGIVHMHLWKEQIMISCDDKDAHFVMPQIS